MDINVLIRSEEGIGFGYVYVNCGGEGYQALMYQDRIDESLDDFEEIIEVLNNGKAYITNTKTIKRGICEILAFYFMKFDAKNAKVNMFSDIREAVKYFNTIEDPYMLCVF